MAETGRPSPFLLLNPNGALTGRDMTQSPFVNMEEDFGADPFAFDDLDNLPPVNVLEDSLAHLMTSLNTLAECDCLGNMPQNDV
jgi:hypothetical protein